MTATPDILRQRGSREQVILPATVALRICVKGIRTRLGRSLVTLMGVALGTAFLMAVVAGFYIKGRMGHEADLARRVERRLTVLRADLGRLKEKKLLVFAGPGCGDLDLATIAALAKASEGGVRLAGAPGVSVPGVPVAAQGADADGADAAIFLGGYDAATPKDLLASLGGLKLYSGLKEADTALAAAGLTARPLDITEHPEELARASRQAAQAWYRTWWIVAASLLIMVIGIANAMLMSVTERVREIATMKCLGALSSFVVKLFLIESCLVGLAGALVGSLAGAAFAVLTYSYSYSFVQVVTALSFGTLGAYMLVCTAAGMVLAILAGIYPARVAARMIPAAALASHV